jgi:DNA-directed RNA polymerase specialized sigma24 family protein
MTWCEDHRIELMAQTEPVLVNAIVQQHRTALEQFPKRERDTLLLDTFEPWLDWRRTIAELAAELQVNERTIRNRLERVKQALDGTLDDPDSLLCLLFTLRMMRMERAARQANWSACE